MRREGGRDEPLVVRFVESLVKQRVVQAPVNPVDAIVGEDEEEEGREYHVAITVLLRIVIEP